MAAPATRRSRKSKEILDEDAAYAVVFDAMTDLLEGLAQRQDIPAIHIVSPLADVLAAVSLRAGGEAALAATLGRLGLRLAEASAGEFPPA